MQENQGALVPVDFSQKAVQLKVAKKAFLHPSVIYPAFAGLGGFLVTLFDPTLLSLFFLLGGFATASGSCIINYFFRADAFEGQYLKEYHETLIREREAALAELRSDLDKCLEIRELKNYAALANGQLKMVMKKIDTIHEILSKKLKTGELTYVRYAGTADQVCSSIIEQLGLIAGIMKSSPSIGAKSIKEGLIGKIDFFLEQNESALTAVDSAIAMIAEMKLEKGAVLKDIESSRRELEALVIRTKARLSATSIEIDA